MALLKKINRLMKKTKKYFKTKIIVYKNIHIKGKKF